jgi:hypothetical protein
MSEGRESGSSEVVGFEWMFDAGNGCESFGILKLETGISPPCF